MGGKKTNVVGKLVDVPVHVGADVTVTTHAPIITDFYVLDCEDQYHWILGLQYIC